MVQMTFKVYLFIH